MLLATALTVTALMVFPTPIGHVAHASGGSSTALSVAVYRSSCTVGSAGPAVGTARFSVDDQGSTPAGVEIRTGLTAGLPRTNYAVSVLAGACQFLAQVGTLTTDDSGRGDLDAHVAGRLLPPGAALRVQLVATSDMLTSDAVSGY
jgi:hypothetical protein